MSMRALIGMVQAFETPGSLSASFISSTNWSVEMWSGVTRRKIPVAQWGAHDEYHVSILRHSVWGFNTMIVSIMENGAGSVDVSARPAFPMTDTTSGNCLMMRSWTCISFCASVTEMPGRVEGMY